MRCGFSERCTNAATMMRHYSTTHRAHDGFALCNQHQNDAHWIDPPSARFEPLCIFPVGSEGWIALECALLTLAGKD